MFGLTGVTYNTILCVFKDVALRLFFLVLIAINRAIKQYGGHSYVENVFKKKCRLQFFFFFLTFSMSRPNELIVRRYFMFVVSKSFVFFQYLRIHRYAVYNLCKPWENDVFWKQQFTCLLCNNETQLEASAHSEWATVGHLPPSAGQIWRFTLQKLLR